MSYIDEEGRRVREALPLEGLRKTIADQMYRSKHEFPQGTGNIQLDISRLMDFRKNLNARLESEGKKVTFGDLYAKLCACAVEAHPEMNGARVDGQLIYYDDINLNIAVSLDGVLMMPVLPHADQKDIIEISDELKKMYENLRKGKMMKVNWDGGTISCNNMGSMMIDDQHPFLNPPQGAHFAIGRNVLMPVYNEKMEIVPGNMTTFHLTIDHGFVDGAAVAAFFGTVKEILDDPEPYMMHKAAPKED